MGTWFGLSALSKLPWKWIGVGLAVLGLVLWIDHRGYQRGFHKRDPEVAALHGTITNMKASSAKALADNEANVARINALQDQVTKDRNDEAPKRIADGSSAIDAYIRLHPAPKADPSGAGKDYASGVPDAPGQLDAAAAQAVVSRPDLDACNAAYVTATGLQDWIKAEAALDRAP
jgi:hypothetical protein